MKGNKQALVDFWEKKEVVPYELGARVDSIMHSDSVVLMCAENFKQALEMLRSEYTEFQAAIGQIPSMMQGDDAVMREQFKHEIKRLVSGFGVQCGQMVLTGVL